MEPSQDEDLNEKLVITMPFNNDLTFPVALHRTETVGNLCKRIADVIGVDQSRVLLNKPSPMLKHNETVGDVAPDNRLQLVVRSSFDFERLRRLIEEDSYRPIAAPELEIKKPEGLASPDLGGNAAFPWRAPILSPQRSTRPARTLKIHINSSTTLTFESPNEFVHQGDALSVSPELYESIRKLLIPDPPPPEINTIGGIIRDYLERAREDLLFFYDRGLLREFVITVLFIVLTPYVWKKVTRHPIIIACFLVAQVAYHAYFALRLYHLPEDYHIDWVGVVGTPDVYTEAERPEDLLGLIPPQFGENTETDEQTVDKIVGAMRRPVALWSALKVLVVSLVPPVYQAWKVRTEKQMEMHRRAVRLAAENTKAENAKAEEAKAREKEKAEAEDSEAGPGPGSGPDNTRHTTPEPFEPLESLGHPEHPVPTGHPEHPEP